MIKFSSAILMLLLLACTVQSQSMPTPPDKPPSPPAPAKNDVPKSPRFTLTLGAPGKLHPTLGNTVAWTDATLEVADGIYALNISLYLAPEPSPPGDGQDTGEFLYFTVDSEGKGRPVLWNHFILVPQVFHINSFHSNPDKMELRLDVFPRAVYLFRSVCFGTSEQEFVMVEWSIKEAESLFVALPSSELLDVLQRSSHIDLRCELILHSVAKRHRSFAATIGQWLSQGGNTLPPILVYLNAQSPSPAMVEAAANAFNRNATTMEQGLALAAERRDGDLLSLLEERIAMRMMRFGLEDPPSSAMEAHMRTYQQWVRVQDELLPQAQRAVQREHPSIE